MSLKERVEQILRERGGESVQPASGRAGHFDGYTVEASEGDRARVRSGYGVFVRWVNSDDPGRHYNTELGLCAELLCKAGFQVDQVDDGQGGHLWVTDLTQ